MKDFYFCWKLITLWNWFSFPLHKRSPKNISFFYNYAKKESMMRGREKIHFILLLQWRGLYCSKGFGSYVLQTNRWDPSLLSVSLQQAIPDPSFFLVSTKSDRSSTLLLKNPRASMFFGNTGSLLNLQQPNGQWENSKLHGFSLERVRKKRGNWGKIGR